MPKDSSPLLLATLFIKGLATAVEGSSKVLVKASLVRKLLKIPCEVLSYRSEVFCRIFAHWRLLFESIDFLGTAYEYLLTTLADLS